MASALNHPHLLTVFDVGEWKGRQYIVTEFVDGGTLRLWAKEPRPWQQVASLLSGLADGLAKAHAANILHRDIKPENILQSKAGHAKLADFGLAKLTEDPAALTDATITLGTRPGAVMGTIAYMSPEQASGKPLDARSDIFSFGVVLYELLGGTRPFEGANDLEVLQKIIHGTPAELQAKVPLALKNVVEKAVEKDPADRYQTMQDMAVDLRRLGRKSGEPDQSLPSVHAQPGRMSWVKRYFAIVAAALALTAAGLGYLAFRNGQSEPPRILKASILPPEKTTITDNSVPALFLTDASWPSPLPKTEGPFFGFAISIRCALAPSRAPRVLGIHSGLPIASPSHFLLLRSSSGSTSAGVRCLTYATPWEAARSGRGRAAASFFSQVPEAADFSASPHREDPRLP